MFGLSIKTASSKSPWAYIREGLLSEGYLRLRFGGLIFGWGLIIGILGSHKTGFSLGGQACIYTVSVCFPYVTVYVTYDRMWRLDTSLGARGYFYLHFFASEVSEQRAKLHQQKITLECVT